MAGKDKEQFKGIFVYTDEVLNDFAAMYRKKTAISPITRLVLGLIGAAGTGVCAFLIAAKGFSVGPLIVLIFSALILLLAILMGWRKADGSIARYRKYYLNKKAHVLLDDSGVELKINGQKTYARSKYKEVYSLLETDDTFFLEVKGRAFYILPKDGMDAAADDIRDFVQKKCRKHFVFYDLGKGRVTNE